MAKSQPGMSDADAAMEEMQADPNGGMDPNAMGQAAPCIGTIVDVEHGKGGSIVSVHVDKEHAASLNVGDQVEIGMGNNDQLGAGQEAQGAY